MQESYFINDHSWLVKNSFINEVNKFLPIYCSVSNFSRKKDKSQKLFLQKKQKRFFIEKTAEKSERSLPIAKVSGKPVETADKNIHSFQLIKICKKRKTQMMTVDFISICGQKNFEKEAVINTTEIKIKNNKTQNMFKTQKNCSQVQPRRSAFFQRIKKQHKKIFVTVGGLVDVKYSLRNGKLYQNNRDDKSKQNRKLGRDNKFFLMGKC